MEHLLPWEIHIPFHPTSPQLISPYWYVSARPAVHPSLELIRHKELAQLEVTHQVVVHINVVGQCCHVTVDAVRVLP